jgi:hypothetical protein
LEWFAFVGKKGKEDEATAREASALEKPQREEKRRCKRSSGHGERKSFAREKPLREKWRCEGSHGKRSRCDSCETSRFERSHCEGIHGERSCHDNGHKAVRENAAMMQKNMDIINPCPVRGEIMLEAEAREAAA